MNYYKITRVNEGEARKAFNYVFPNFNNDRRRLSSIAFYLNVEKSIADLSDHQLIIEIGSFFVRQYGYLGSDGIKTMPISYDINAIEYSMMEKMASFAYVSASELKFLLEYDPKSIRSKLYGCGIFDDIGARNSFSKGQAKEVVLSYLFDKSNMDTYTIEKELARIRDALQVLKPFWKKRLEWFDNEEKLNAAIFYSNKAITDVPALEIAMITQTNSRIPLMPAIQSRIDLEIFFHDQKISNLFKEFVFNKITGLYNNRVSRREKKIKEKKKSCSFILTKEAEELIKEISKENMMKGSSFLNVLFQKKNKEFLKNILQNHPYLK